MSAIRTALRRARDGDLRAVGVVRAQRSHRQTRWNGTAPSSGWAIILDAPHRVRNAVRAIRGPLSRRKTRRAHVSTIAHRQRLGNLAHSTPGTSSFDPLIHSTPARIRRTRISRFELVHEQPGSLENALISILRRRGLPIGRFTNEPDMRRLWYVRRWDDMASHTTWFEWVPL